MNVKVSAVGMTAAVGHDAATCCAAIRAGISRAAPMPHASVLDPDAQALIPVIGHAVWGLTEGMAPVARWLVMASNAFKDLCHSADLPDRHDRAFWSRVGFVVIAPELDDDRFLFCEPCRPETIRSSYVDPLIATLQIPFEPQNVFLLTEGRSGALRAIAGANSLFAKKTIERLVVLAADSYLDGYSLQWLGNSERLKAPDHPTGLMPGEAAVAMMIDDPAQVSVSSKSRNVSISAVVTDREATGYEDRERKHGRALARSLKQALQNAQLPKPFTGDLITDLNGEAWRAYEFGAAISLIDRAVLQDHRAVLPVLATGDVGAASALLSAAVAVCAFERGYARGDHALVACMSLSGRAGALVLEST